MRFVGRSVQLHELDSWYTQVARESRGLMLAVRGRRQVGKSRLYTEFIERSGVRHVYFTAVKNGDSERQMLAFQRDVLEATSPIPNGEDLFTSPPNGWTDALGRVRIAAQHGPMVLVLDEFPWAAEADPTLEGELQTAWDRHLQHLPVLIILVGSDVAMMERLTSHDRPLFGRAREDVIEAFNPAEVRAALGSDASALKTFDGYLATGGYPKLVDDFARAGSLEGFVEAGLSDDNSDLIVMAQRSLDAEFPPDAQARRVLSAIGGQDVGHSTFSSVVGRLPEDAGTAGTALTRALKVLAMQRDVVAVETPAGQPAASRLRRYRITDPYLRFWFRFVEPHVANVARGRSDIAVHAFEARWSSWRGVAVEPVVRDAICRLAPNIPAIAGTTEVGAWWNRDHSVEVDIVATSGKAITAIGSVKWRQRSQFKREELDDLAATRSVVPHAGAARLIAVCPAGFRENVRADVSFKAEDLLSAWAS
ncbi:MAG: ATP-binding protein [Ilumatobacteraceae bacterium]